MANANANTTQYIGVNTGKSDNMNLNASNKHSIEFTEYTEHSTEYKPECSTKCEFEYNTIPNPYGNFTGHHHNHDNYPERAE